MKKHTLASTMRFQDANLGQEVVMITVNAGMVIPECAYIFKQEGVKRVTTAIFTMEERVPTTTGVIISTFHTI